MDNNSQSPANPQPTDKVVTVATAPVQNTQTPQTEKANPELVAYPQTNGEVDQKKPKSKKLVYTLRFLVVFGGFFATLVIGLGISFSACFTIKGPPPPHCGPVSIVTLILMPAASLLFLIPLSKKIK